MPKLHIKRCILFLVLGLSIGGYSGWKSYEASMSNPLSKFVLTGKVF